MKSMENRKAPEFSLLGSDGKKHALSDYQGSWVVLYFYPKDNTTGCTKEACGFRDRHEQLVREKVVVLGMSKDSVDAHDKFILDFKLPFLLLSDPETKVMAAYGAWGEKTIYGKPSIGTIRSTVVINPDGTIIKHWPMVKNAEGHPQEVLDFILSLA
ncbi:MAG: peroxiredoxin [Lentisphaerota bacterium]